VFHIYFFNFTTIITSIALPLSQGLITIKNYKVHKRFDKTALELTFFCNVSYVLLFIVGLKQKRPLGCMVPSGLQFYFIKAISVF